MIIGIDSSRLKGEITIFNGKNNETLRLEYTEDIPYLLYQKGLNLNNLEAIAVSIGPGSFTGLRIGLAIAKGLSFRANIPVYGINTFDGMVINLADGIYIPILYAKTDFVYSGIIEKKGEKIIRKKEDNVYSIEEVIKWDGIRIGASVKGIDKVNENFVLSSGLIKLVQLIKKNKYKDYIYKPEEPIYLSLSEAEIKRSSQDIKYEDIKNKDLSEIMNIEKEAFKEPWNMFSFRYILSSKNCYAKKAVIGDVITGYIIGCFEREKFHFMNIAIRKNLRRKGIGKSLVYKMIKDIEKTNAKEIYLEVRINNEPAINLYKKMGFKIERIERNYYENGDDAIVMSLRIK